MKRLSLIRLAALTAVTAAGFVPVQRASADDVTIRVGEPRPVYRETVYTYDSYVVGYRRDLYNADWRLRVAQADEIRAERDLSAARMREGEIAVALDDREAAAGDLRRRVGDGANAADLRVRLSALEKRIASAKEDLDAARTLNDQPGIADADRRLRDNQAAAEATYEQIKRTEDMAAARRRLAEAEDDLARTRADLDAAHDGVFAAQDRLAAAHDSVVVALHDRDESLWLLYSDDIYARRIRPETVGFSIDLNAFGGRWPSDREELHRYVVRDVGYWRDRPTEVYTRVVEVDRVTEVTRIREVERSHEPERIKYVETIETSVTPQERRGYSERVVAERQRFEAEQSGRKTAAAEGRKYTIDPKEKAEAKAIVMQAHADAKATEMKAHAEAKATEQQGHADAKATKLAAEGQREQDHADAKSKALEAEADAKAARERGHADAKSEEIKARADAKAAEAKAHADGKSEETRAHGDARAAEIKAKTDVRPADPTPKVDPRPKADVRPAEPAPKSDPRPKTDTGRGDKKPTDRPADRTSSSDPRAGKDPRGAGTGSGTGDVVRDPKTGKIIKGRDPIDPRNQ